MLLSTAFPFFQFGQVPIPTSIGIGGNAGAGLAGIFPFNFNLLGKLGIDLGCNKTTSTTTSSTSTTTSTTSTTTTTTAPPTPAP